jgi:hypothetical protein
MQPSLEQPAGARGGRGPPIDRVLDSCFAAIGAQKKGKNDIFD